MKSCNFVHRGRVFEIRLTPDHALELWYDGVCRKRRDAGASEPQYVWTNVELEWEEHHYVEVRYWRSEDRLRDHGEPPAGGGRSVRRRRQRRLIPSAG